LPKRRQLPRPREGWQWPPCADVGNGATPLEGRWRAFLSATPPTLRLYGAPCAHSLVECVGVCAAQAWRPDGQPCGALVNAVLSGKVMESMTKYARFRPIGP